MEDAALLSTPSDSGAAAVDSGSRGGVASMVLSGGGLANALESVAELSCLLISALDEANADEVALNVEASDGCC